MNSQVLSINDVLRQYFSKHPISDPVPAKRFMDAFVKAGIFTKDHKEGYPIRQLLRELDESRQLHLIPYVIAEQKAQNTNWFFAPAKASRLIPIPAKPQAERPGKKSVQQLKSKSRSHSDECYVLDLCDQVLGQKSFRQHRFDFMLGDPNSAGRCAKLPVDGWYESLNLVIEYNERQHTEVVKFFDRRMTVSGKTRGEQRAEYDKRKLTVLPKHGIALVVLSYEDFEHNGSKRLLRNTHIDRAVIRAMLQRYIDCVQDFSLAF